MDKNDDDAAGADGGGLSRSSASSSPAESSDGRELSVGRELDVARRSGCRCGRDADVGEVSSRERVDVDSGETPENESPSVERMRCRDVDATGVYGAAASPRPPAPENVSAPSIASAFDDEPAPVI